VLFRPFHIADRIEGSGIVGVIREVNLFYSEIDTDDNVRVVVPNGKLWGEIVKVTSRNETERVELKFTRPLSDDITAAIDRVREIVRRDQRISRLAQIGIESVTDTNYVLVTRLWAQRREAMQVHFDVNRAVIEEFQRRVPIRADARAAD
jgi:small conductance mechanosensitive channel